MARVKEAAKPHQGKNIRFFRTAKDIKQEDFAEQLGVAQSNVTKLERRSVIEDDILLKSANILGVSIEVLKELDLEKAINDLGKNVTFENFKLGNGSVGVNYNGDSIFNPTELITTLIERLVKAETKVAIYQGKRI